MFSQLYPICSPSVIFSLHLIQSDVIVCFVLILSENALRFREIHVRQCLSTNNPPIRIVLQQTRQKIRCCITPQSLMRYKVRDRPFWPLWKFRIVMRKPVHAMPIRHGIRCAPPLKDFDKLINVGPAGEEWQSGCHFGKDTSHTPNIDCGRVSGGTKEKFRCAIPESDDLVGVWSVG